MDSMLNAIRNKRQSTGESVDTKTMMGKSPESESDDGGTGMQDLLTSLTDEQKTELKMLLDQEQSADVSQVEKGGPSKNEERIIAKKALEDNESADKEMEEEGDDIALSMIDRNSLQKAEQGIKPRDLGDRAKMMAAQRLKQKGITK